MEPLILLALLGVGGAILFSSKSAQASSSGAAPWSPGAPNPAAFPPGGWSASTAPSPSASNPSGLEPGFQGEYGGPQGGEPGVQQSSGLEPGFQGQYTGPQLGTPTDFGPITTDNNPVANETTASGPLEVGTVGWNPFTKRWY